MSNDIKWSMVIFAIFFLLASIIGCIAKTMYNIELMRHLRASNTQPESTP